jgi:hypothetical protein
LMVFIEITSRYPIGIVASRNGNARAERRRRRDGPASRAG